MSKRFSLRKLGQGVLSCVAVGAVATGIAPAALAQVAPTIEGLPSPTSISTQESPESGATTSPSLASAKEEPQVPAEQPAPPTRVVVDLNHPVSVSDALSVTTLFEVSELRYNVEGASGGVVVAPDATAETIQSELDKATQPYGFEPPIDMVVVDLPAEDTPASISQDRIAPLDNAPRQEEMKRSIEAEIASILEAKPEETLVGSPEQPVLGNAPHDLDSPGTPGMQTFQAENLPRWTPSYANSTAWEFEPGIATFRHDLAWQANGGFISDVADGYGFEIGEKQYNNSLPELARPFCPGGDDSAFWAQREGGGLGGPKTWTVMIPGNDGSNYAPYWDYNNAFDGCNEMEFPIGIGYPQEVTRSPGDFSHIFTEIRTARGITPTSVVHSELQTVQDNCFGVTPNSDCMGLNVEASDGQLNLLSGMRGDTVPASWHTNWVNGVGEAIYVEDKCATYGRIRDNYLSLGEASGPLGTCETWAYDAANGGEAQNFANGRAYWHPQVAGATSNAVWGAIGSRYLDLGAEIGPLKYPTSNELSCPSQGSCFFNRFETGNIYWSPTTGAHGVWGAIFQEYGRQGYEQGRFGLPTTSEFDTPDGKQVNFEGGWIRWLSATGEIITS